MNQIIVNRLYEEEHCKIIKSSVKRDWMNELKDKFAYRCLPMNIANQCSWSVLCPSDIKVTWNGDNSLEGLTVEYLNENNPFHFASSNFGYGTLTFHSDFVLTTTGTNCIYCKGPANSHKTNLQPLEGIIETFWLPFTFTMNWRFQEPGFVYFEKDEPIFSFFPIDLNYVESFQIKTESIHDNLELLQKYNTYSEARTDFINKNYVEFQNNEMPFWQKFYTQGKCPFTNFKEPNHKSKLDISEVG